MDPFQLGSRSSLVSKSLEDVGCWKYVTEAPYGEQLMGDLPQPPSKHLGEAPCHVQANQLALAGRMDLLLVTNHDTSPTVGENLYVNKYIVK